MEFSFAHFSDVHLGPMPRGAMLQNFAIKRLSGGLNWAMGRHKIHRPEIAQALRVDILAHRLDHLVCTGDMVNVSAHAEYPRAAEFLRAFGAPETLSLVPGNHDAYVDVPYEKGWAHYSPWMKSEFPYVTLRKNIAFIGLSSSLPQPLFRATGELGTKQLNALGVALADLKSKGFCRVVMIHHPPVLGLASARKALKDADELEAVLKSQGAELVVFGHLHKNLRSKLETSTGQCHLVGVASASSIGHGHHEVAAWNQFRISRGSGAWNIAVQRHEFDPKSGKFNAGIRENLTADSTKSVAM